MTALRKPRKFTVAEYLLVENAALEKSEFYDGEVFAMAGASPRHNRVWANLFGELCIRLKGHRCQPFGSDQRVRVEPSGLYTYPDMLIACDPLAFDPRDANTITNPTVLFEVLSPSTEKYDRGAKLGFYQEVESVREIVHVWQDTPRVEVHCREPSGGLVTTTFAGLSAEFRLECVPLAVPLADIYRGVTLLAADR